MVVDADVSILSTSGWAHGMTCTGKKLVYCHAPARWLYQRERYIGVGQEQFGLAGAVRRRVAQTALGGLRTGLMSWDRKAAASADRYLVNSTITRQAVADAYGIDAEVLPPPPGLSADGPAHRPLGLEPGFALCVARLLPYKNVDVVIDAIGMTPGQRLVVVGDGPELGRLERQADAVARGRVTFLQRVSDEELRWLYENSALLIAASHEDYGLSPIEAASFGKPTVALEAGGYLDTVVDNVNGVFFPRPEGPGRRRGALARAHHGLGRAEDQAPRRALRTGALRPPAARDRRRDVGRVSACRRTSTAPDCPISSSSAR